MSRSRPAAEGVPPGHFPGPPVAPGHVQPCPRRLRARDTRDTRDTHGTHGTHGWIVDTTDAFYVWEHPFYPQYAVPAAGLPAWLRERARSVPADERLLGYVVLGLDADLAWFEEDEPVHGHPRSPYVRVDALRSHRTVSVVVPDGPELARTSAPVAVFETGLPPRWYVDRTSIDWSVLQASSTTTRCPYKGVTSEYWSHRELVDVAWSYGAPMPAVGLIAGLVAFDDTMVTVRVTP